MAMTKVEFENKCMFMLKSLCDMNAEEILKMSTELSRVELNDLSEGDYLNLFITLRVFEKNVDIALAKNELFRVQQPRIVEDMMNTHKAFQERGVCDIVMDYMSDSIYTDGFAEIRDLCDDVDKRMIDINPEIFFFLDEVAQGFGLGDPLFDGGFSGLLEYKSIAVDGDLPVTTACAINHMTNLIDYIPYAFYKAACEYIEEQGSR